MESLLSSFSDYFNGSCTNSSTKIVEINNAIIKDISIAKYGLSTCVRFENMAELFWINQRIHLDEYRIGDTVSFKYQIQDVIMNVITQMTRRNNRLQEKN